MTEVLAIADFIGLEGHAFIGREDVESSWCVLRECFDIARAMAHVPLLPDDRGPRIGVAEQEWTGQGSGLIFDSILLSRDLNEIIVGPHQRVHVGGGVDCPSAIQFDKGHVAPELTHPLSVCELSTSSAIHLAELPRERGGASRFGPNENDAVCHYDWARRLVK